MDRVLKHSQGVLRSAGGRVAVAAAAGIILRRSAAAGPTERRLDGADGERR